MVTYFRKRIRTFGRFTVLHASEGGGLVLREEVGWRNASGFAVNGRWGCLMVQYRRVYKLRKSGGLIARLGIFELAD